MNAKRVWLVLILLLSLAFRWLGPFLQQSTGDSLHYVALAMKLKTRGLNGYNLRGVDFEEISLTQSSIKHLLQLKPSKESDPQGGLMRHLHKISMDYYDEPLHHIAYGYPVLLMLIHKMNEHAEGEGWQLVHCAIEPWDLIRLQPIQLAQAQWRWVAPALFSSLGMIVLTYFLGTRWFGKQSGLWAAFLMAIHPIDILTSQRIWADDALVFMCLVALLGWCRARDRASWLWALASGIALGCAILFKQSALFLGVGLVVAEGFQYWRTSNHLQGSTPRIQAPMVFACAVGLSFVTAHWFATVWGMYGTPFYNPPVDVGIEANPWYHRLQHRPSPIVFYILGTACLSPCMLLGWLRIGEKRIQWLFLVVATFFFIIIVIGHREYRYILPVLPLSAIAAGYVLMSLSTRWKTALIIFIVAQIAWSLHLTNRYTWQNWGEVMTPF